MITGTYNSLIIDSDQLVTSKFAIQIEKADLTNPVIQRIQHWVLSEDCCINKDCKIFIEFSKEVSEEENYVPKDLIYKISILEKDQGKRPIFIVKNFGDYKHRLREVKNLSQFHSNPNRRIKLLKGTLPKIAWCERIVKFSQNQENYFIGIFHCAPGESLHKTFWKIKDIEERSMLCFQFGVSLANFHLKFLNNKEDLLIKKSVKELATIVHGDLHFKNIFFKKDKGFWFIDYDYFQNSTEAKQPIKPEIDAIASELLEKYFFHFITGYSSCYPKRFRSEIMQIASPQ